MRTRQGWNILARKKPMIGEAKRGGKKGGGGGGGQEEGCIARDDGAGFDRTVFCHVTGVSGYR